MNLSKNLPFYLVTTLVFLLPLFFIPVLPVPLVLAKSTLVFFVALVSFLMIAANSLKDGKYEILRSKTVLALGAVVLVYFLSTIFSPSLSTSFWGYGFELDTFFSVAAMALLFLSVLNIIRGQREIFYVYLAFLSSFLIISIYQIIRAVFPPDFLTMGIFYGKTANLIGKWSDLGVLSGLALILSLASIELLQLARPFRVFLYVTSIVALFILAITSLQVVWIAVAFITLLLFIYNISRNYRVADTGERRFSATLGVTFIIALVFIIGGSNISGSISNYFGIGNVEARPSWQSTIAVAKSNLTDSLLLGAGPNRFSSEWVRSKPLEVNSSAFWNTDFNFGIGFLPSTAVSVGLIGLLAWVAFVFFSIYEGFKALFRKDLDGTWEFFIFSSLVSTAYLWILSIFYAPNVVVFALAFISTGILIASSRASGALRPTTVVFSENPRTSFISVFSIIVVCVVVIIATYFTAENAVAHVNYQKGLQVASSDLIAAERYIARANILSGKDLYTRALADISVGKMQMIVNRDDLSEDIAKSEFQNALGTAIVYAKEAVDYDPTNYQNWLTLGGVYESVVPFKVDGAYEKSIEAYNEAIARNPNSPVIYLLKARLEAANENIPAAKENISKALQLKNNYTEAIFFLSQIEVSEGKIGEAIKSVEAAAVIAPNDPAVFFQLGFLRYSNDDFTGAISALERAVILNPVYSNAKYFLGLSYYEANRRDDAIAQFEDISYLNPENAEVKSIISNLKAGLPPLKTEPPVQAPEEREELPIEE